MNITDCQIGNRASFPHIPMCRKMIGFEAHAKAQRRKERFVWAIINRDFSRT
jgi:hypothetical protein